MIPVARRGRIETLSEPIQVASKWIPVARRGRIETMILNPDNVKRDPRRKTGKNRNLKAVGFEVLTEIPVARRGRIETLNGHGLCLPNGIPVARRGRIETLSDRIL